MYVVKNEGSWVLFTKSNYLLNRALLNRGLGVPTYLFYQIFSLWKYNAYDLRIEASNFFFTNLRMLKILIGNGIKLESCHKS